MNCPYIRHPGENNERKGFTLVELLVVISIIAILSVIGITIFTSTQKSGRDAKRRADLEAVKNALEQYKTANGSYPTTGAVSHEANWDCNSGSPFYSAGMDCLKNYLVPNYISSLPKDPLDSDPNAYSWTGNGHFYTYHSDGSFFQLSASLENKSAGTGDFTYQCACTGCGTTPAGAHVSIGVDATCIMLKANGGIGYDSQQ